MNKIICILFASILFLTFSCSKKEVGETKNVEKKEHQHKKSKVYYTCSMHPKIKEEKPGKCPICHMNLTKIELDTSEDSNETNKSYYTCPMHPKVKEEKPGHCPICHMNLNKVEVDGTKNSNEMKASKVVGKVKLRKAQLNHFSPAFFPVTHMKMTKKVRLLGSVLQSEEKESQIPARVGGRVEKVYVKSTGSFIKIGDPVLELYSPKLITAGEEYLLAKQSFKKSKGKEFLDMIKQSEERLKLWGIKKSQYESWSKKNKVPRKITIFSAATGIVRKKNASVGKYFKEGQNFFELSDLADVWVEMDVYEHDSSIVRIGQKVELEFTSQPGEMISSEIDFVNPFLDESSRTLKVRATIKNEMGKLKPGMIANAVLNVELAGEPLVVPRSAVIDTGKRKVVWVKKTKKEYFAKIIHAGYESDGYVEIKDGLREGEEVVIEGSFLLDAQAQLFGGYEDMLSTSTSKHNH